MLTPTDTIPAVSDYVCEDEPIVLPDNIRRIQTQADLYTYGVRLLGFLEVSDEAEAIKQAEGRQAFLLKSTIKPCSYLIFPHMIVEPY